MRPTTSQTRHIFEVTNQLEDAQNARLRQYYRSVSRNSEGEAFDDRVEELLYTYAKDTQRVKRVIAIANRYGYYQDKREARQLVEQMDNFADTNRRKRKSWMKHFKAAYAHVSALLPKELDVLFFSSGEEIITSLRKLDTHPGWWKIETGNNLKRDFSPEEIYEGYKEALRAIKTYGYMPYPILIGVRTQASGLVDDEGNFAESERDIKYKTRLVSMIDFRQIMVELMFAKPLQVELGSHESPYYAGGFSDDDIHMWMKTYQANCTHWYSLDYSKFDQSIPGWLIEDAFSLVRKCFKQVEFPNDVFSAMVKSFIHKVFLGPNGYAVEAHDGVPSGSMFTQIIDTIVNMLVIYTYMYSALDKGQIEQWQIDELNMMIMGDDNILFTRTFKLDIEDLSSYLDHNFGILMNPDKASQGKRADDPEFLSRTWTDLGPWRGADILILKLVFPERFREYIRKGLRAELYLYAYYLSYSATIEEHFKMKQFFDDYPYLRGRESFGVADEYLPGSAYYRNVVLGTESSKNQLSGPRYIDLAEKWNLFYDRLNTIELNTA